MTRVTSSGALALGVALAILAGCGESDTALTAADVARRGGVTTFSETFTQQVYPGQRHAYYDLHCLDGSKIAAGSARIVAVTGKEATARDYAVVTRVYPRTNKVMAQVSTTRASFTSAPPAVTLELKVTCDNRAAG